MISNKNLFLKIDPENSEKFQKLVESNIDFIKFRDKIKYGYLTEKFNHLKSNNKRKKCELNQNQTKSLKLNNSLFQPEQLPNKSEKEINKKRIKKIFNTSIDLKMLNRKKTLSLNRLTTNLALLNVESSLDDDESFSLMIHNVKNDKSLVSPVNLDQKYAFHTSGLNLKTSFNFNYKKNNLKLPKINGEQTEPEDKHPTPISPKLIANKLFEYQPIMIRKISPRAKYSINDLANIRADILSPEIEQSLFNSNSNLPDIKQTSRSNEIYLYEKSSQIHENLFNLSENEAQNYLPKPKFELFLNKINKKRNKLKFDLSDDETSNFNNSNININPTAKLSEVNDKIYLDIFLNCK